MHQINRFIELYLSLCLDCAYQLKLLRTSAQKLDTCYCMHAVLQTVMKRVETVISNTCCAHGQMNIYEVQYSDMLPRKVQFSQSAVELKLMRIIEQSR